MRWVAGWSAATGHPWTEFNGVWRIATMLDSRRFEYLATEPTPAELAVITARIAGDNRDVVTVFTRQPEIYLKPHDGLVIDRDDEALMTCSLSNDGHMLPAGFESTWELDGARAILHVTERDHLAAAGNAATVGTDAIFDRIETMPRYRRRGLGSLIMNSLSAWGIEAGATTGILAASADGQQLYASLGWQTECSMLVFRGASGD